jgi:hypothetical protein
VPLQYTHVQFDFSVSFPAVQWRRIVGHWNLLHALQADCERFQWTTIIIHGVHNISVGFRGGRVIPTCPILWIPVARGDVGIRVSSMIWTVLKPYLPYPPYPSEPPPLDRVRTRHTLSPPYFHPHHYHRLPTSLKYPKLQMGIMYVRKLPYQKNNYFHYIGSEWI